MTTKFARLSTATVCALLAISPHLSPGAEPGNKSTFKADCGKPVIPSVVLPIKKMPPNLMEHRVFFPVKLRLASIKAPAKLGPDGDIIIFSNPGKNFRVELTVEFETNEPTKLAANLLMEDADILPDALLKPLKENHTLTWHFDTETRSGYESASGKGAMTFDLTGAAPAATGTYRFLMNLGLFRREDWVTEVLYQFKVTLINDPAVFCQTEPVTEPDPLDVVHEWKSPDGRVLKGRFVETAAGRVTIDKEGARVDIPLGKLSPESKALAGKLAECAAVAVLSGNPDIRSSLASGPPLLSWTSAEGKAIEAEFVKLEGDVVSLRLKGREVPIPLNRLDDAGGKLARRLTEAAADPARATDG